VQNFISKADDALAYMLHVLWCRCGCNAEQSHTHNWTFLNLITGDSS